MGNCFRTDEKSTAEIAPHNSTSKGCPIIRLYGSPDNPMTSSFRFALGFKPISLIFIPSSDSSPVIHFESDVVSGSLETVLVYLDSKFPEPPLTRGLVGVWFDKTTPSVVWLAILQHRSMKWHLERLVRWADDLAARGGRCKGDPMMGTPQMEVRKFWRSYSQLLDLMLEHAQMEETIIFPVLEMADPSILKVANQEHGRDLPVMNGIKEDIKSVVVLSSGSLDYQEALFNLSARLKTLQTNSKEHFDAEERHLLPLMEAVDLSKVQEAKLLERCMAAMPATHSNLLKYFMEGLLPQEGMQYLDLITKCSDREQVSTMLRVIVD